MEAEKKAAAMVKPPPRSLVSVTLDSRYTNGRVHTEKYVNSYICTQHSKLSNLNSAHCNLHTLLFHLKTVHCTLCHCQCHCHPLSNGKTSSDKSHSDILGEWLKNDNTILSFFLQFSICHHSWKIGGITCQCILVHQSMSQGPNSCWNYVTHLARSFATVWEIYT